MRVLGVAGAILLLLLTAASARSETVFVQASYAEIGNGWLFGSRSDRSCWLAFPYHIIEDGGAADASGIAFRDQSGRSGETGPPIHVTDVPGAEGAAGHTDLAFARVTVGRKSTECPSRLGLPPLGYVEALRSDAALELTYLQKSSAVTFVVDALKHVADDHRGSLLLLRARNPADSAFFQGGISGAVAELRWQGNLLPAAMILNVTEQQSGVLALRFDRIRAAFDVIEGYAHSGRPAPSTKQAGLDFTIVELSANVGEGSTPLSGLDGNGTCWRAAPPPGERAVEILLSVPENMGRIASIRLFADPACGPRQSAVVETASPGGGWTMLSGACLIGPEGEGGCRINRSAPRELRLRVSPLGGWLGLSQIILD
jgi:hypothetical protein